MVHYISPPFFLFSLPPSHTSSTPLSRQLTVYFVYLSPLVSQVSADVTNQVACSSRVACVAVHRFLSPVSTDGYCTATFYR